MAAGQFGVFRASEMDAIWRWRAELGVPEHASPEEIKRAYWRAVKQVHPDLHPDDATAAARFRSLHEGYEALIAIANRSSVGRLTDAWEGQF
jgi:molecular chaperone DnaJ